MGEAQGRMFEPTFNRAVKVEASDSRLTSDGGAIVLRDFDHRLESTATIDIDSFPLRVHGEQQGAAYYGHYDVTYHP